MKPPTCPKRPLVHDAHGVLRPDPYAWLRDRDDEQVLAHLRAENAYTEARTAALAPFRKRLYSEMLGRIQEDDSSVPARRGNHWYITKSLSGAPYAQHHRRTGSADAPDVLILDENQLAEGQTFFELGALAISPDGHLLAYATDTTGGERYQLRVRDLRTGEDLPDIIEDIWPDIAWSADSAGLLYGRLDEAWRPHEIWLHRLGQPEDVRVYHEPDTRFRVFVDRTLDDAWLFVGSASSATTELHYAPATQPEGPYTCFAARHEGHEYTVTSQGERFWVLTNDADGPDGLHNDAAVGFALKEARVGATERNTWITRVPAREGCTLEGMHPVADHLVLLERREGLTHIRVLGSNGSDRTLDLPGSTWVVEAESNLDAGATHFRYTFQTLTQPPSVCDLDLVSMDTTVRKVAVVRGGHDPQKYVTWRMDVPSVDGVSVPVSLVRRGDTPLDGSAPLLLYGYGAYGLTIDPSFSSTRLSMLDRGAIYAIAHVRGGAYLGRPWREAGRLAHKQRSFDDFIAVIDHLSARGVVRPDRLAIEGGSAGGLLVGAVLNQAPGKVGAAIAQVPFVDVVTSMLDVDLPLTTTDWDEWGNPSDRQVFDRLLAYSPYDNVRPGPYPPTLVTAGLNDPRVPYWEPAKWVARLRDHAEHPENVLFKVELEAGHGGKSGRYGQLEEIAFETSWLLHTWGHPDTLA